MHGPPGTGKSSFIKALAGALDYNICIISLNESNMTDDRLSYLLSVLPERSFLLLEDIDALFTETRQTASTYQSRITFSGLLNALDGVGSSEERLVFMTTNHFAKIDAALMRPGRVDVIHFVGMASQEQIYRMFCQFYPKKEFRDVDSEESHAVDAKYENMAREFCGHIPAGSLSPASIQGHFIMFKNNPQAAIDNIHLLLKLI